MARFSVDGLADLGLSFEELERLPREVIKEMLYAGAEPVVDAQNAQFVADGLQDKGTLAQSSQPAKNIGLSQTGLELDVYPHGMNHTYTARKASAKGIESRYKQKAGGVVTVTNAEVAFIHEIGAHKRNIKATQSIRKATEKSAEAAVEREREVYEAWLQKLGF